MPEWTASSCAQIRAEEMLPIGRIPMWAYRNALKGEVIRWPGGRHGRLSHQAVPWIGCARPSSAGERVCGDMPAQWSGASPTGGSIDRAVVAEMFGE